MIDFQKHKDLVLDLFQNKYYSANMIAAYLTEKGAPCSRQGVILALRSWGMDTSKGAAGWVNNTCPVCGRVFPIKRCEMRKVKEAGKSGKTCPFGNHVGVH